jgi:hypothetical protein
LEGFIKFAACGFHSSKRASDSIKGPECMEQYLPKETRFAQNDTTSIVVSGMTILNNVEIGVYVLSLILSSSILHETKSMSVTPTTIAA